MEWKWSVMVVSLAACVGAVSASAQEPAMSSELALAATGPKIAATVGKAKIPAERVDRILAKAPAGATKEQLAVYRKRILDQLIEGELVKAHLQTLPCSDQELNDWKKQMTAKLKPQNLTLEQFMVQRGLTDEVPHAR